MNAVAREPAWRKVRLQRHCRPNINPAEQLNYQTVQPGCATTSVALAMGTHSSGTKELNKPQSIPQMVGGNPSPRVPQPKPRRELRL